MANAVEKVNGIAAASIEKINGLTDANMQALNGLEFTGTTTQTEDIPYSSELTTNQEFYQMEASWLARSGTLTKVIVVGNADISSDDEYKFIVLTLNGTSAPSVSSTTNFPAGAASNGQARVSCDPLDDNEGTIAYVDGDDSDNSKVAHFTIDPADESVTFGTPVQFCSGRATNIKIAHDMQEAGRFMVCFKDGADSDAYVTAGSTSGTTITLGTTAKISTTTDDGSNVQMAADPNNARKVCLMWIDNASPYYSNFRIATADTSRSLTLGTVATDDEDYYPNGDANCITWDKKTANKIHTIGFNRSSSHYVSLKGMTVDGTDLTLGTLETLESVAAGEGCSISSDYFIANAGMALRQRGSGANNVEIYAWTVDGTDYTAGTNVNLSTHPSSSGNSIVASPYTAGLHLAAYQEHDGSQFELAASSHLLGGTY